MAADAFDADVRRTDEDRWLASRFAPAAGRRRLVALYALNHEIARTAEVVTQGALGDIRLAWWREGVEDILAGKPPRAHPVLQAVADVHAATPLPGPVLLRLVEARGKDFDPAPFPTWDHMHDYIDATVSGLMLLGCAALGVTLDDAGRDGVRSAGHAWGYAGALRVAPYWRARGRATYPGDADAAKVVAARARDAYEEARGLAKAWPKEVFPAVGYAALVPDYLAACAKGEGALPLLGRQLKLVGAAATGRI